jgi:hypothetical protein
MKRLIFLVLLFLFASSSLLAQVFSYKRPSRWQASLTPGFAIIFSSTGIDNSSENSVSDFFKWGAGLTFDLGIDYKKISFSNRLRMGYQQTHRTGSIPLKGPSILEFATRPVYKLLRESPFDLDLCFQAGIHTHLFPETNAEGSTTGAFLDPGATYEGVYFLKQDEYGEDKDLKITYQLGYALQQLVYKTSERVSSTRTTTLETNPAGNLQTISGNGIASILSLDFTPRPIVNEKQNEVMSFRGGFVLKLFRKNNNLEDLHASRVEGLISTSLTFINLISFESQIELIYDDAISSRREMRSTLSVGIKYNLDLSTN